MQTFKHQILTICLFSIAILLAQSSLAQSLQNKLAGTWAGTENNKTDITFIFDADTNAKMLAGNESISGETIGGTFIWRLDSSKTPMHLDLIGTNTSTKERKILPMIVEFITDNQIKIRTTEDMLQRPTEFSDADKEYQMILTRQQQMQIHLKKTKP